MRSCVLVRPDAGSPSPPRSEDPSDSQPDGWYLIRMADTELREENHNLYAWREDGWFYVTRMDWDRQPVPMRYETSDELIEWTEHLARTEPLAELQATPIARHINLYMAIYRRWLATGWGDVLLRSHPSWARVLPLSEVSDSYVWHWHLGHLPSDTAEATVARWEGQRENRRSNPPRPLRVLGVDAEGREITLRRGRPNYVTNGVLNVGLRRSQGDTVDGMTLERALVLLELRAQRAARRDEESNQRRAK
jgi:hypothetical protein